MANPNGEAHQDVDWRDAWDADSAVELLRELADQYGRGTDFNTANELLAIASFVEWPTEELR
jgi:hypothetical protein